jgi:hypothetical protein
MSASNPQAAIVQRPRNVAEVPEADIGEQVINRD